MRKGAILTADQATAPDRKKEPDAPEPAPRFARFKLFRSSLTTWESLFAEAAEFAGQLGPDRLITVSHSADNGEGVVAVWYWEGPEWEGLGTAEQKEATDS